MDDRGQIQSVNEEQVRSLVARLGFSDSLAHLVAARDAIREARRELSMSERFSALGLPEQTQRLDSAERNFDLARRNIREAGVRMRQRVDSREWRELAPRLDEGRASEEGKARLTEAAARWTEALANADIPPSDAAEIKAAWDETARRLEQEGVPGLTARIIDGMATLEGKLNREANWGRNPASPLEDWALWLIIIVIGIAICVIIACIIWGGCAWIAAIIFWARGIIIVF